MEQLQRETPSNSLLASATEDELVVSQILLDLRTLMSLSESLSNFNWGRRRRRSCLEPPATASPEDRIEERTKAEDAAVQDEKHGGGDLTTASPDTPLSFSPSESDEKPKNSSKKRSREKYLDMIAGLTQRKELLAGEIENVKKYYNKLNAYNSKLKAMKQQVLNSGINLGMEWEPQHPPLDCQHMSGSISAHFQPSDNRGPLGIDLNLPGEAFDVELSRPLDVMIDDKRARFAEARRKRIGLMKIKSTRNY